MRVAIVCPRFYPYIGGVETHVLEISKRLAKKFDIEVITTDPTGKLKKFEEMYGFKVRRFKSFAPNEAYYFSLDLYRFIKREKYDIIHAHNYHAFPALLAFLAKNNSKFIFTPHYHGKGHSFIRDILHKPYKVIGRKMFEDADAIICVSRFEKKLVLKNFHVKRLYVIPNGINLEEFNKFINIKNNKKDYKRLLFVGRIEKYKGLQYVVKALKYLPDFKLDVVGAGSYKTNIIKLASKIGVLDRIRFYQNLSREELLKLYAKAGVLVLLSKFEAYGIVVSEALASRTPCIVARTSALAEFIDNKNVFGIDYPIDVKELAELIRRVSEIKVKGVKLISWDEVAKRVERIYFNVT